MSGKKPLSPSHEMKICVCLILLALLGTAFSYKSYSGYQVLQTRDLKAEDIAKLAPLMNVPDFDFWVTPTIGRGAQIMASPYKITDLRNTLKRLDLQPQLFIEDVGILIAEERRTIERMRALEKIEGRAPILDRYLDFVEIQAYIDEVAAAYPEIVTVVDIGSTFFGRHLRVVKISNGPGKTGIMFNSLSHAREWLGVPTILYAINELTENLANNRAMLDANDFYFLPVVNPDGYTYSWTNDRLWRKNRAPHNSSSFCLGTDIDRNFDQHWDEVFPPGGDCNLAYVGRGPFSEFESTAIADFLLANPSITFYVSVQSYGENLLYPYTHTSELPPNVDELDAVAQEANTAIQAAGGNPYEIGSHGNIRFYTDGNGHDWAYDKAGISLSYLIELPGGGETGFEAPVSMIQPTCAQTWAAYKVFASRIPASRR